MPRKIGYGKNEQLPISSKQRMYRSKKEVAKTDFKKCFPILPSNFLLRHYLGPFIPEFKK